MAIGLSVIIPFMSREEALLETLGYLQRQSLRDFEVVIGSVGKPPKLDALTWDFPLRIVAVAGAWDVGHARNVAAKEASSGRLFFLDCDITPPINFVELANKHICLGCVWFPIVRNSSSKYNSNSDGYRIWGFGNCGIMQQDLMAVGGWDRMSGWDGEDDVLQWKCKIEGFKILRLNSDFTHRDHRHDTTWHGARGSKERRVAEAKQRWRQRRHLSAGTAIIKPTKLLPNVSKDALLVAVMSCRRFSHKREACRASWIAFAAFDVNLTVVFVVGSFEVTEPKLGGDTLSVPCDDDYESLPQKVFWLAKWAAMNNFSHLFKCDDDTFVYLARLCDLVREDARFDYRGHEVCPGVASGGAGYLLSHRAIQALSNSIQLRDAFGPENVWVSKQLALSGMVILHDKRFWPRASKVPTVWNNQISTHYIQPAEMSRLSHSLIAKPSMLFRIVDAKTQFGAVGVNSYRGFNVKGVAEVELPEGNLEPPNDALISAHACSSVKVEIISAATVTGFLDAAAINCGSLVEFLVDGTSLGKVGKSYCQMSWMKPEL